MPGDVATEVAHQTGIDASAMLCVRTIQLS
jgi:hypothetical protein